MSRWISLILALASAALLFVAVRRALSPLATAAPLTGMALLEAHECRLGEKKIVDVRGVEDDFSPQGEEPMRLPPQLAGLNFALTGGLVAYDSADADSERRDYFEWPPLTVSGIFVAGMKRIGENDELSLGESAAIKGDRGAARIYRVLLQDLVKEGWRNEGNVYWTNLETLRMQTGERLLDVAAAGRSVDVSIGDDTMVDFMASAVCVGPESAKGVTFRSTSWLAETGYDLASFQCDSREDGKCDPFVGDRPCDRELPLLCFKDLGLPARRLARDYEQEWGTRRWSGGEVAATAPLRADRFRTIADADVFCAAEFGEGWRVAEWHLGGMSRGFTAQANGRKFEGRYWIDIRGAPHGTCWDRDDG